MPSVQILIDSSFLYALFDHDDAKHQQALNWAANQTFQPLVPQVVLGEVMFLLDRNGGVPATLQFLDRFTSDNYVLESVTPQICDECERSERRMQAHALILSIAALWRSRSGLLSHKSAPLTAETLPFFALAIVTI